MGLLVALFVLLPAVAFGRFIASRAFGIRGWKPATEFGKERGRPALAFARAGASIVCLYLACVVLFVPTFMGGRSTVDDVSMRVTVMHGGPAERAGIRDGDRIVGVNGEAPKDWDHLKKLVGAHPDATIEVEIEREGARRKVPVTTIGPKMMVGPHVVHERLGVGGVLAASFRAPLECAVLGMKHLFSGRESTEVAGPVAIAARGSREMLVVLAAITSQVVVFVSLGLLLLAAVLSVLPTSGNSS